MSKKLPEMPRPVATIYIGRAPENTIVINDTTVSGQHAQLGCYPGQKYFLVDCHSRNGTFLLQGTDGRLRISQEWVSAGDEVCFGSCHLPVRALLGYASAKASGDGDEDPHGGDQRKAKDRTVAGHSTVLERCVCGALRALGARCGECGN